MVIEIRIETTLGGGLLSEKAYEEFSWEWMYTSWLLVMAT